MELPVPKKFIQLPVFFFVGVTAASPLMDTTPGTIYVPPPGTEMVLDLDRPTTQFVSPNHGSLQDLFPTFQVALLNETGKIAFVTAESPVPSLEECHSKLKAGYRVISNHFQDFSNTPSSESRLGGENEFSKNSEDVYFVYECSKRYGPFWSLHFQIRSQTQDMALKSAWETFFESRH